MLSCQSEDRRDRVRKADLNGLDFLEVSDDQRVLTVYFLGKAPRNLVAKPEAQQIRHVSISGGRRPGYRAPDDIHVLHLEFEISPDKETDDRMIVTVNQAGDFSTYVLCLVEIDPQGQPSDQPYPGFDTRYFRLEFSFKAGCPSDLDCLHRDVCPPTQSSEPEINYLAKDYDSFRQLILDRLALVMPDWRERHEADIWITLVELLAYAGDYLSYHQDAVATEAYLDTSRQRISVRRHAQLVDYQLHEGCNARAWVFVEIGQSDEQVFDSNELYFTTGFPNAPPLGTPLHQDDLRNVPTDYLVFEPLVASRGQGAAEGTERGGPLALYRAHNEIFIYTWGNKECCLLKGATSATLKDDWMSPSPPSPPCENQKHIHVAQTKPAYPDQPPEDRPRRLHLQVGDFLLFEEICGPKTGNRADADPAHRQVVRITKVLPLVDKLCGGEGQPVVEVEWGEADALAFPLCISAVGPAPACDALGDISVVRGNIVLVDHGRTIEDEPIGVVPVERSQATCLGEGVAGDLFATAGTFRPILKYAPITSSAPLTVNTSAASIAQQGPRQAVPSIHLRNTPATRNGRPMYCQSDIDDPITLTSRLQSSDEYASRCLLAVLPLELRERLTAQPYDESVPAREADCVREELRRLCRYWEPRHSLLDSRDSDSHFVAEIDNHGRTWLRFGDGEIGRQPQAGAEFRARYRVGNGLAGNVGSEAIRYIVFRNKSLSGITLQPRNPLPARGGTEPESIAEVKQFAPHAFRRYLRRAITGADYAHVVQRDFRDQVQRAAATTRWTGSDCEVLVAVDVFDQFSDEPKLLELLNRIRAHLYLYRRIGHEVRVEPSRHISLYVAMTVCVQRDYLPGDVKDALQMVFSNRLNPDGTRGFFHRDNLSFGEGIFLSRLVAAAQRVDGVENVVVTRLQRLHAGPAGEIEYGILPLGRLEIARLDNDASFPENGKIEFVLRGGR